MSMVNERQFFWHFSSTIFEGNLESRLQSDGRFGARTEDAAELIRGRGAAGGQATLEEFGDEDPPSSDSGAARDNDSPPP